MTLSFIDRLFFSPWPWLALGVVALSLTWMAFEVKRAPLLDEDDREPIPFPARLRAVNDALDEVGHTAEIIEFPFPVCPRDGGYGGEFGPGPGRAA